MAEPYEISNDDLLSTATVSRPHDRRESLDDLSTTPRDAAGLGVITAATPGVEVLRDGAHLPVQGKQALLAGDKVLVPKDGAADVVFPGRQPHELPLSGKLTGGSEAVIGLKAVEAGQPEQITVDLVAGDLLVDGADTAEKATSLAVKKPAIAAVAGGLFDDGLLALAGLAGLAALGASGGSAAAADAVVDPTTPPIVVPPTPTAPPVASGDGLLTPTATVVNKLTDVLATGPLAPVGQAVQPLDQVVGAVTDTGNRLLAPLLGDNFGPNHPNALDPVDTLAGGLIGQVSGLVGGLADPLLGSGATAAFLSPLSGQVDYLTDGVNHLLTGGLLGDLLGGGGTATGTPLDGVAGGLGGVLGGLLGSGSGPATPGASGLLDPAAAVVDHVTNALDSGVLATLGLGGVLQPVDAAVATVTDAGNALLAPLLGSSFGANSPNALDPVDSLVGQVSQTAGGLLGGLLDPVLGQGAVQSLVTPLATQVDFATDGLNHLLGGLGGASSASPLAALSGALPTGGGAAGADPLAGLLAPLSGLLGGVLTNGLTHGLDTGALTSATALAPVSSSASPVDALHLPLGSLQGGLLGHLA